MYPKNISTLINSYFMNILPMIFFEFLQLLVSATPNFFSKKKQLINIEYFIIDFSIL